MKTRVRRVRRRAVAGLAALTAMLGGLAFVGTPMASAAACSTTALVPTQREFVVGQGLPGDTLVRGKETLVRVLTSLPDCATSKQSLTITSASLSVFNGTTLLGNGTLISPTDTASGALAPYTSNPVPSDPFFVVPPTLMTPCGTQTTCAAATDNSFSLTFNVTVSYTGSSSGTPVAGTKAFTQTSTIAKKSNALRVLVVPMGDASQARNTQYTAAGDAAVQRAFSTVSRTYPVPCAAAANGPCVVNDLTASSGGIRYSVDPGLLDLRSVAGAYDANGKFCGGGANFDTIKSTLSQYLQSWNTVNSATPADRVIGVVDEAISDGVVSSGGACVEGMAAPNGLAGWFRASYTSTTPVSGSVLGMELAHTFGDVPFARSSGTYHSPNSFADGTSPGRGHNVSARTMLTSPRSAMKYTSDPSLWNDSTTLFEPLDQQYLLCSFGGPTDSECTTSGGVGTTNGVGAGLTTFVMSGVTQGTAASTKVVESYFSADVNQPLPPDPASPDSSSDFRLLQLDSTGAIARNSGVRVSFASSGHSHDGDGDGASAMGLFSVAFDGFTGAGTIRFYKCPTGNAACDTNPIVGGGTLLYEVVKPSSKPSVTSSSVAGVGGLRNYTNDATRDDTNAAVSSSSVAWVAKCASCLTGVTTIHVAPISDRTAVTEVPWANDLSKGAAQTDPAWRPNGTALAFVVNGNLYTAAVNPVTRPPSVSTPVLIYAKGGSNPAADTPTWSADGSTIFFHSAAGGIFKVAATGGKSSPLVSTPAKEASPSASHIAGDTRLTYAKGSDVWLVDTANPSRTQQVITDGATPVFMSDGRIAFVRGGALWSVKADGTGLLQLTSGTTDANPYEEAGTLAFDRPATGGRDVFLASTTTRSMTATVTSPVAGQLKGELLLTCPDGTVYPLAVGISPVSVDGNTAMFVVDYDESIACGGSGTLTFVAVDGWSRSDPTAASRVAVTNTIKPPVAAISNPVEGTSLRPSGVLSLNGTGTSPQEGSLSGSQLRWTVSGTGLPSTLVGTGNQLDVRGPGGSWPAGTLTITVTVTDSGGRTATDTRHVRVDGTAPAATILSKPADPGPGNAGFTFTASDPTDPASNVTIYCGVDSGPLVPCSSSAAFENLSSGDHTFWLYACDAAGNCSLASYEWTVDADKPGTIATTTPVLNANGWTNATDVAVTLTADDGTGSGVNRVIYALTGAQTGAATVNGFTTTFHITAQGKTIVTYHAVDNVGNVEDNKTLPVGLDSDLPIVHIDGPRSGGIYLLGQKLTGCAGDSTSGVDPVVVTYTPQLVGIAGQVTATYTGTAPNNSPCGRNAKTWSADLPVVGVYQATANVTDLAGNQATPDSVTFTVSVGG